MTLSSSLLRTLDRIEVLGNRLPPPAWLFVWLCGLMLLASALAATVGWTETAPDGREFRATSLLNYDGLRQILSATVTNFTGFAPVGPVLVAMLGLGLAERSGLLGAALAALVRLSRGRGLPALVAFAGVMSSVAADAGYVVVIPLAGLLFQRAGLPPVAGIACAFAGVAGGFSANLLIGPLDAMLVGLTTEAVRSVAPDMTVPVTANYYFMMASTPLVTVLVVLVNRWLILPRLAGQALYAAQSDAPEEDGLHSRGALAVLGWTALCLIVLGAGLWPSDGPLRGPGGGVANSPAILGVVTVVAVYAGVAGLLYGRFSGRWRAASDAVEAMEDTMRAMAGYLVLMFFAAQFVAWFQWSQLGTLTAIAGAEALRELALPGLGLLLGFVLLVVLVDLLIGSASAKWAVMAPVFVPMFMLVDLPPAATLAAYRVGDSVANIITPLMPYFAMVVAFTQRFQPSAGIGTLMALMLPYSLALLLGWSLLLAVWITCGWPLGPGG